MTNNQIYPDTITPVEELRFDPVSRKYRAVQMVLAAIAYMLLGGVATLLLLADSPWWCVAAEALIAISLVANLMILRKAYQFKGYALREHDITYRSGVIFPTVTTIPFARIQQVSISQNPVSKYYGLCSVDITNGAQGLSSVTIPGLSVEKAESIKNAVTRQLNDCYD